MCYHNTCDKWSLPHHTAQRMYSAQSQSVAVSRSQSQQCTYVTDRHVRRAHLGAAQLLPHAVNQAALACQLGLKSSLAVLHCLERLLALATRIPVPA